MLVIRQYTKEDIAALVLKKSQLTRIHVAIDPDYYEPDPGADEAFKKFLEQRVDDADFKIFIANENDTCVGYVMGWVEQRPPIYRKRKVGYLSNIFVDDTYQRREGGARLYRALETWFHEKNVDFIEIRADVRNSAAMKSFKKYGLQELSVTFYKKAKADRGK